MTNSIKNFSQKNSIILSLSFDRFIKPIVKADHGFFFISINNTAAQKSNNTSYISSELFSCLSKIDSFGHFHINWNGYGALPFSKKVLDNAKKTVMSLNYLPEIFPVADGSIQFEFDCENTHLELQIYEDHVESYQEKDGKTEELSFDFSIPTVKEIVDSFYG